MDLIESSGCLGDANFWPPGFRFHPTDEELVLYYLKRKICRKRLKLDIVAETDVYKWDPEELPGQSKLKSGDRQWFFFSPRDRKYPNGARSNRATRYGYWKATGNDRKITYTTRSVGVKKTLVFYQGRAPSGKRTDWVMHEYTLDEEELKRCQAARDYYALYKVFKKSGPGPKNGEQYGAPFKEEDWADDECLNVNDHVHVENSVEQVKDVDSVDNIRTNSQVGSPLNDFEEFMNRTVDDPSPVQPLAVDYAYAPYEAPGTMVDPFLGDPNLPERSIVLHPSSQQYDVQTSFDLTQSTTSQLPLSEAPEVSSASNIHGQQSCVAVEDFLEDFLEMDDLIGPEPSVQGVQNPVENFQLEELDGLFDFDLFHDAPLFLPDVGPVNPVSVSDPCLSNIENGMVNPAPRSYVNNLETGMAPINPVAVSGPWLNNLENLMFNPASHSYLNNLGNGMVNPVSYLNNLENDIVNQLDYQLLQSHSNDACCSSSQHWTYDQSSSVFTPAEPNQMTIPQPISGVVYAGNSANLPSGANQIQYQNQNQNQNDKEDDSWISSALWSFVESIPTTPASASESALMNRAFDRISSFRRLRINGLHTNVAAATGNPPTAATERNSGNCNRGFFYFSVLGVVCAILWILIGTSVKVLGRFISS